MLSHRDRRLPSRLVVVLVIDLTNQVPIDVRFLAVRQTIRLILWTMGMGKGTVIAAKGLMWKVAVHRDRVSSLIRIVAHAVVVVVVVAPMVQLLMDQFARNQAVIREDLVRRTTAVGTVDEETVDEETVVAETVVGATRGEMMEAAVAEVAAATAVVTVSSHVAVADVIRDAVVIPVGFVAAAQFNRPRKSLKGLSRESWNCIRADTASCEIPKRTMRRKIPIHSSPVHWSRNTSFAKASWFAETWGRGLAIRGLGCAKSKPLMVSLPRNTSTSRISIS
jgi:hypothetical protein